LRIEGATNKDIAGEMIKAIEEKLQAQDLDIFFATANSTSIDGFRT
jgi:hypothetical protein